MQMSLVQMYQRENSKMVIVNKIAATAMMLLLLVSCQRESLSQRMVRSEMQRCPTAADLDGQQGQLKWNYTTGLELLAFLDAATRSNAGASALQYVDSWYDAIIGEDGTVNGKYKRSNYSLDHVCPARTLLQLYEITGKQKYRAAMDSIYAQIQSQPRTEARAFWHKKIYPHQVWLDGLYMAHPFYAAYSNKYLSAEEADANYTDIATQFRTAYYRCYDPATRLLRHAWDESRTMFWADPQTGQSDHAWGRALGWYSMALVDVLELLPETAPGREDLVRILRSIFDRLPEYADPATGMWYQVLDCPGREGNYVEATCSAMFVYSMLKGIRLGLLDIPSETAREKYDAFVRTFIVREGDLVSLERCCEVAGLGGKDNRRGDYDYYINERVRANDPKGIGPAVWAALEMELCK